MIRCDLCPGKHKCLPPDGPVGDVLLIGEAAGYREEKAGRVFVGNTGQELDRQYLPLAGMHRANARIINAIACYPDRPKGKINLDKRADRELLECCAAQHLYPELERTKPKLIVAMGAFACYALDPSIDLDLQHGIPVLTKWGTVFPQYHPALGLHAPKSTLYIRNDWVRLRKYIKGKLHLPVDEYEGREDYRQLTRSYEVANELQGMQSQPIACDTESMRSREPFCLTFSVRPGSGYLIRADSVECLGAFQRHLDRWQGKILFHNWLYDCDVVQKMGLRFATRLVRDTMVRAYQLANLPQGLKALAYRELGMSMLDFDDLVTPHSLPLVLNYYRDMVCEDWPTPEEQLVRDEDGKWKLYKPQNLSTKLRRFWTDYSKAPDTVSPFDRWSNWEDYHPMIEDRLGPFPGKCISYAWDADREATIRYACLSKDSKVSTPSGFRAIGDLVNNFYGRMVHTYDDKTDQIVERRVIGRYRIKHDEPVPWVSIETEHTRLGRWNQVGTRYTPDHRILTPQGYRQVSDLRCNDQIYLPIHRLNSIEWQVVYGSLLGDGSVSRRNSEGWANLRFSHNERQKEYLLWKAGLLTNLSFTIGEAPARELEIDSCRASARAHFTVTTRQHPELVRIREDAYLVPGRKCVNWWSLKLGFLGLAIWYQDDGTLVSGKYPRLYTLGFTKDDIDNLRQILLSMFGLDSNCYETNREGQWAISIPSSSCDRFFGIVSQYVHPSMQYKLPDGWHGLQTPVKPLEPEGLVISTVKGVERNPQSAGRRGSTYYSYCLDVEETHNFLTMGEIAHNCRDADATLRLWHVLQRMTRQVRRRPQDQWGDYDGQRTGVTALLSA